MTNKDYIDAYKSEDRILTDYYKYRDTNGNVVNLEGIVNPLKIDNRQIVSPVDNQKDSPHCAGFSAATMIETLYWKQTGKLLQIDSHQVYSLAKQLDGDIDSEGTFLEHSLSAALTLAQDKDGFEFLKDAKIGLFYNHQDLATIESMKYFLKKYEILQVGFSIDDGWYDCDNENYILQKGRRNLGGHAVNICGYDSRGFYVMNQWSTSFGAKGFAIIPYDLMLQQLMYGAYIYNITY